MLHGLKALDEDPATKVIVLVSKPPAPEVATAVLAAAEACSKPVVAIFLGADPASITRKRVYGAAYLAQAADMAVRLAQGEVPQRAPLALTADMQRKLQELARGMAASQRYVRGIFSGGTFCFEAQLIHAAADLPAFSNAPTTGNKKLVPVNRSQENTIIDMGDDEFTQGRPHPMIDPSLRDDRICDEIADPATAVVLFDVVLGYGASMDPAAGLLEVIRPEKAKAEAAGRRIAFIGYVCGTDKDPQKRAAIVAALETAGVLVASSNAEAALWSATIIAERNGAVK
jgi:succinyl-CoA synthetase alpha subunit